MTYRTCPFCDELNPPDAEFCDFCHQRIVVYSTLAYFNGSELRQPKYDPRRQSA
jgi:hypothetical protein